MVAIRAHKGALRVSAESVAEVVQVAAAGVGHDARAVVVEVPQAVSDSLDLLDQQVQRFCGRIAAAVAVGLVLRPTGGALVQRSGRDADEVEGTGELDSARRFHQSHTRTAS